MHTLPAPIDPARFIIHAFHRNEDGHWTFLPYTSGETVELSSLGLQVPVAEIYAGTEPSDFCNLPPSS